MRLLHDHHDSLAGEVEPGRHDRGSTWACTTPTTRSRHAGAAMSTATPAVPKPPSTPSPQGSPRTGTNRSRTNTNTHHPGRPRPTNPPPPEAELPGTFAEREDMHLIRAGLAQLAEAEQAAEEVRNGRVRGSPTPGEILHSILEHQIAGVTRRGRALGRLPRRLRRRRDLHPGHHPARPPQPTRPSDHLRHRRTHRRPATARAFSCAPNRPSRQRIGHVLASDAEAQVGRDGRDAAVLAEHGSE